MIPQLLYFNLRARGEVLRLMFLYSGIPFEDVVVPITDWASGKFDKETIPAGRSGRKQLPVLLLQEEKKMMIPESLDIAKWIATTQNPSLMPTTPENQAKAERIFLYPDEQVDNRLGLTNPLLNFFAEEDVASTRIQGFAKMVPHHLEFLEKEIISNNGNACQQLYVCGPEITYPDFIVFHFLDNLCTLFGHDNILEFRTTTPKPILKTYYNNIRSIPTISQRLEARPKPGSGLIGKPGSIIFKHKDPSKLDFVQQAWKEALLSERTTTRKEEQ